MPVMYLGALFALAVTFFAASAAWAQPTFIEWGLAELGESPPAAEAFDFIVVADSNTLKPLEQSAINSPHGRVG